MRSKLLRAVLSGLKSEQPPIESKRLAAVAVIVVDDSNPRILLIKRAEHSDDPWSGQVAFPGGKMSEGDKSAKETAVRETKEEVGVDLAADARFAGYFIPFRTHTGGMDVVPAVFLMNREVEVTPNGEVSGHKWVGLDEFLLPGTASTYHLKAQGFSREMPAFAVGDYVIWGLTHRIISSLLGEAVL
jgi:8-oxo-dGTP pyrophosphatase MutT (NUDIX family)